MDEAAQPALPVSFLPLQGGMWGEGSGLQGNPADEHRVVPVPVVSVNWGG